MAEMMENSFLEGNGIVILLLFFLMFGWNNGGGFGFGNAAAQGSLTRAELADGFNINEIQRNQSDIKEAICATNNNIMQSRYDTLLGQNALGAQIAQNRYDAALQAQNVQSQMASCCCDIKTALHAEGEATRALIQQNTIQELRDNLQAAQLTLGNAAQTQNLLSQMGRWVANAPVANVYGGCGCGCGA